MQYMMTMVMVGIVVCLSGCGGGPRQDRRLYSVGSEPQLRDSEIVIETFSPTRTAKVIETRRIRCSDGVVHATVTKPQRRGEGELSQKLYGKIWAGLLAKDAFALKVEPAVTDGGLYHLIRLRLGRRHGTFSAQRKANFFGFGSTQMQSRMDLLNHIVRYLGREVETTPISEAPVAQPK